MFGEHDLEDDEDEYSEDEAHEQEVQATTIEDQKPNAAQPDLEPISNLKEIFAGLLPTYFFKWDGDIKMTPDLGEVTKYCTKF